MKCLILKTAHYQQLWKDFATWLDVLGYAETTVNALPIHVKELLYYLEANNINHITQAKSKHIHEFIYYIKQRHNLTHGGLLSSSHVNKIIQSINTFARYLNQTGKIVLDFIPKRLENVTEERIILSREEIKALYEATFEPHRENTLAMGQRDRAIIAVFYGCGLRKDEGTRLNITDIDFTRSLLFVRKGKGNKQRYVPVAHKHLDDLRSYIEEGRYWFFLEHRAVFYYKLEKKKANADGLALFINQSGQRMKSFYQRLDYLRNKTDIEKPFGLHALRHSIATHLLQSGMKIEEISKFLGHSTLESTQIYTHIINEQAVKTEEKHDGI